jgi:hypothetical protein
MPIRRFPRAAVLLLCGLSAAPPSAQAAEIVVAASNPGPITGSGRTLAFDLSAIAEPIVAAQLEVDLDYSRAGDLDLRLVDASGGVELPLAAFPHGAGTSAVRGRYRFADRAGTTWWQADVQAAGGTLSSDYATRAFQAGLDGSQCLNLIGRYLEFDIGRAQPVSLRIARAAGATPGMGRIDGARLVLDTATPDAVFRSGLEEPAQAIVRCRRPSLDLLPNGASEGTPDSPLAVLHYAGGGLDWYARQTAPVFDAGPIRFGNGTSLPYAGRFGGRSRLNLGFWDPVLGSLNFTTGAGARSLALEGDWTATEHYPLPGDYDGDGVTDLAMAFRGDIGGLSGWLARVHFSSTSTTRDFVVDPRVSPNYTSAQVAFGPGQDADLDGIDEITTYARNAPGAGAMSMVLWQIGPGRAQATGIGTVAWGEVGDTMVLGRWIDSAGPGNRLSQMVVRRTASGLDWYLFGNPTPVRWGLPGDQPLSIHVDADVRNDIAVFRPSDGRIYAIRSSDGVQISFPAPGPAPGSPGLVFALGFLQGTLALPQF